MGAEGIGALLRSLDIDLEAEKLRGDLETTNSKPRSRSSPAPEGAGVPT